MPRNLGKFGTKIEDVKEIDNDWRARKAGYTSAGTIFRNPDLRGKNWGLFIQLVKDLTTERNVPALEKGLEAALVFVSNCSIVDDGVVQILLEKVVKERLSDPKSRVKELANGICMALFDRKKHDMVMAMLLQGMEGRIVKQAFSCIRTLTNALIHYGPTYVNISTVATKAIALCKDKTMFQQDMKDLLREIYKWNGPDGTESYLKSLDASQRKAMEVEFVKVGLASSVHGPLIPKHQTPVGSRPKSAWIPKAGPQVKTNRPSTTSQSLKKVTDLPSSPKALQRRKSVQKPPERASGDHPRRRNLPVAANKMDIEDIFTMMGNEPWRERKEAVDELYTRIINSNTAISPVNFGKMIKRLRVLILEDPNVALVSKAIKCVSALANSQHKEFKQHVPLMMTLLLEKFKDKKNIIIDSTREAIDAIYLNFPYGNIARYVALSLISPNPAVKTETAFFVQRCFARPTPTLLKVNWHPLVQGLLSNLPFPDGNVRATAMQALGTILKAVGETALAPYLPKIPKHQMTMIVKYSKDANVSPIRPFSRAETENSVDVGSVSDDLISVSSSNQDSIRPAVDSLLSGFKERGLDQLAFQGDSKNGQVRSDYSDCSSDESVGLVQKNGRHINITGKPPRIYGSRKSLSPAARQKLASFRTVVEQLKEAWRSVGPNEPPQELHREDSFESTADKISRKLQHLEGTVSKCFVEIRQLSPHLNEEIEHLGSQSKGDVLRALNQRLYDIERLLRAMAFETSPSTPLGTT